MSARSAVALQRGANEEMLDAVDDYESSSLTASQKAALALADVYLSSPGSVSDAVRDEVRASLSDAQVVETVLKLMGFSSDKAMVALGLDFEEVRVFTL